MLTMHPLVERIEKLFLPDLKHFAAQMRKRFPALAFNVWQWPTGAVTEYIDYDVGVECVFPVPTKDAADNVALMIELCFLNSRPRIMAHVVGDHPSADVEAAFRENCLTNAEWPEAKPETIEELKEFMPTLFRAFESAVERGMPTPSA